MTRQIVESESSQIMMNEMLADIILDGNIKKLNRDQKKDYVMKVCEVTGLNPALRPFDFITLQGREIMYANKQAAEQLRQIHNISITDVEHQVIDGMIFVTVKGHDGTGRYDSATAALPLPENRGDAYSNQVMKCETKAKRRFTLSICGLAILERDDCERVESAENDHDPNLAKFRDELKLINDLSELRKWYQQLPSKYLKPMKEAATIRADELKESVLIDIEAEEGDTSDND